MAAPDLQQLRTILENATANEQRIADIRKAFTKLEVIAGDIAELLAEDYKPEAKERKPREVKEGAKRPGRPRKQQAE